jgi:hypothetical protein
MLKSSAAFRLLTWQTSWKEFSLLFVGLFFGSLLALYVFVLLTDPYGIVPFSLPLKRALTDPNQRYMYPQVVRSGQFDSFVIGTSTSRLLDPEILNQEFGARFANLAMDSSTAWEQKALSDYFFHHVGHPKVMIVGFDSVWCTEQADVVRITARGFPYFLFDDDPWNDYLYLLNSRTVVMAGRLVGYQFGLYKPPFRNDGYGVFVPPEADYDLEKVRQLTWDGREWKRDLWKQPPLQYSAEQRAALKFPALDWLDEMLLKAGPAIKILAIMPLHVAAQDPPSTEKGAAMAECKARIVGIAKRYNATVIDWLYPSALTSDDSKYWDVLHYRVPVASSLARAIGAAALHGEKSADDTYRILLP